MIRVIKVFFFESKVICLSQMMTSTSPSNDPWFFTITIAAAKKKIEDLMLKPSKDWHIGTSLKKRYKLNYGPRIHFPWPRSVSKAGDRIYSDTSRTYIDHHPPPYIVALHSSCLKRYFIVNKSSQEGLTKFP